MSSVTDSPSKRRLAYVSPIPPDRSGIADYSADLIPELARWYALDIVAPNDKTPRKPPRGIRLVDVAEFEANAASYDRVLYHFGNSTFHSHMFDLLERYPGVVVLHDFFLSGIIAHLELNHIIPEFWSRSLYRSHGYLAVRDRFDPAGDAIWKYPANLGILQNAVGIISHSAFSQSLAHQFYGDVFDADWQVIPLLRRPPDVIDRAQARETLGLTEKDVLVCSFGMTGPTKLNDRLVKSWLLVDGVRSARGRLTFVGEEQQGNFGEELRSLINAAPMTDRIQITGFASQEEYRTYLTAADMAIQLRTASRGETSAAAMDCLNFGVPLIVNAHGSLREIPDYCALKIPDEFTDADLANAIQRLLEEGELRRSLSANGQDFARKHLAPEYVAASYERAIETFQAQSQRAQVDRTLAALAAVEPPPDEMATRLLAIAVSRNQPHTVPKRQLLVDVSELVRRDVGSGIQRVTRNILRELLEDAPEGFRVEPVYAREDEPGYRYARAFTLNFIGVSSRCLDDAPVELRNGDIFLGLDLQPHIVPEQREFYAYARNVGARVYFVVYDLLPVTNADSFLPGAQEIHERWLSTIGRFAHGVVCISRAVADDFVAWEEQSRPSSSGLPDVGWFHLGANIDERQAAEADDGDPRDFENLGTRPTFLMVGTLEPRKGHSQVLSAFDRLWDSGEDINLVIVGKPGWMVGDLVTRLRAHPQLGSRLHWKEKLSDSGLERIYAAADCLIAASAGEGFGLPLIEAANYDLPVIARDIPVFREVAGDAATYFSSADPDDLAGCLAEWLRAFRQGRHVTPEKMKWLSWAESKNRLMQVILDNAWYVRRP